MTVDSHNYGIIELKSILFAAHIVRMHACMQMNSHHAYLLGQASLITLAPKMVVATIQTQC